ncbi:MAG TPA: hypothetical protein PK765_02600 [bacterium]|nr:hypothetical protein [bacterium]
MDRFIRAIHDNPSDLIDHIDYQALMRRARGRGCADIAMLEEAALKRLCIEDKHEMLHILRHGDIFVLSGFYHRVHTVSGLFDRQAEQLFRLVECTNRILSILHQEEAEEQRKTTPAGPTGSDGLVLAVKARVP